MIYITQLVYVKPGEEFTFQRFEEVVMPLIQKYNGKLLLRIRPEPAQLIEGEMELPYEIHLVQFSADSDLENYSKDRERLQFLHLREQSVRSSLLIKGSTV